jgi:hypothetical protein
VNGQLLADLAALERAELSREEVLSRHGDAAADVVALHDRLRAFDDAPPFDVDAGWALVAAKIAPPAIVVPLRPGRPRRRLVALAVAAALMLGGSALALVLARHDAPRPAVSSSQNPPAATLDYVLVRPHGVHPFGGPDAATPHRGESDGTGGSTGGSSSEGPNQDDPNDRDHGTGNDGSHDDQGKGNDGPSGSPHEHQGTSGGDGPGSEHASSSGGPDAPGHGRGSSTQASRRSGHGPNAHANIRAK